MSDLTISHTSSNHFSIRPAVSTDVAALFDLILALAEYERLRHEVIGSAEALHQHLFGDSACIEALVAEHQGQVVGFALFFISYSTFITQPGVYLEDLFVLPQYRGQKVGKALLVNLARLTVERGYGRLEWSVLDWNEPAIGFYKRIGAEILEDVRVCRVAGTALPQLAATSANLRLATRSDSADIFALVSANIEHDGSLQLFKGNPKRLAEHLFDQHYVQAVVVEQAAKVVGLALFYTTYSTFLTKPGLFIEDLFVLPEYRGQSFGKALLANLAQQVIERDYGRLEWRVRTWNQPAIEFYQRIGATLLPDWRVCLLYRTGVEQLALEEF